MTIVFFLSSLQQKEEIKEGTQRHHVYKSLRNDACLCAVRKPHHADLFDQCKSLKWEFGGDDDVVNDDCDDDDDQTNR